MLSEKFPEKIKLSKAGSQPKEQGLLEASFLREMGGHTLFQRRSRRKGFGGGVALMQAKAKGKS
jgi:hypothetical protein